MALTAGTKIGPYEVIGLIGQGGMGEVWQARDTKFDRDVALEVLPEAFTQDPDRLAPQRHSRRDRQPGVAPAARRAVAKRAASERRHVRPSRMEESCS